jgi:hypothetical protein
MVNDRMSLIFTPNCQIGLIYQFKCLFLTEKLHLVDYIFHYFTMLYELRKRWDNSVCIATSCWAAGVRFPGWIKDFSLLHSIQSGSGVHPASYLMGTAGSFPGGEGGGE